MRVVNSGFVRSIFLAFVFESYLHMSDISLGALPSTFSGFGILLSKKSPSKSYVNR